MSSEIKDQDHHDLVGIKRRFIKSMLMFQKIVNMSYVYSETAYGEFVESLNELISVVEVSSNPGIVQISEYLKEAREGLFAFIEHLKVIAPTLKISDQNRIALVTAKDTFSDRISELIQKSLDIN
jgi:hypothetical protein